MELLQRTCTSRCLHQHNSKATEANFHDISGNHKITSRWSSKSNLSLF
uniref:Uncharacterized protein n=1 Tax=Rhizophora mucronata TaxID=61149 RepID=A0A2P2NWM8_RHIMU